MNLIKQKFQDWVMERIKLSVYFIVFMLIYLSRKAAIKLFEYIVGAIILYFQLGIILAIVIWGMLWFLGKISPHLGK